MICDINKKIFDVLCLKYNYWDIDFGLVIFYLNEYRDILK